MADTSPYVLIVPHYSEAVFAFMNVIQALQQGSMQPLVLVTEQDTKTREICEQYHIAVEIMPPLAWHHQLQSLRQAVTEPLRVRHFFEDLFKRRRLAAVLLVDDRRYNELFLIAAARRRHIPTIVLMWAATNSAADMTLWRQKSLAHIGQSRWRWLEPLIRWRAPQAIRDVDGKAVYWQHPLAILTLALLAGYPPQPWILGGGTADWVAVMGAHYRDLLLAEGVAAQKIAVTGHPRHDDMVKLAAQWRQTTPAKPYILLAAPPVAHIQQGTRGGHISAEQMHEYLHWVIEQLLELPLDVMVKPHPRDSGKTLAYLNDHRRPIDIKADQPVAPLVARAALLVCQGSSVVLEACGLNIPVVTFDFHNTPGYDMWGAAGAAVHVRERDSFPQIVCSVLGNSHLRQQLEQQREEFVTRYMCLDGKATERVITLIQQTSTSAGKDTRSG
jgi:UDP-N-acetylglucosamine 2-epimerase